MNTQSGVSLVVSLWLSNLLHQPYTLRAKDGVRMLKIGSLCTGYGGLDMAVEAYFDAETVWTSDIDKYASIVIKERLNKPNLGDLKGIDWAQVEPIDILTAGYPCQPFSHAGFRKGTDDKRHIFPYILEALSVLRPRYVILENVRGHLSLGLKEVLAGLASIGYDAKWRIVRASDTGAPHRRERVFIVAQPSDSNSERSIFRGSSQERHQGQSQFEPCQCGEITAHSHGSAREESRRASRNIYGTTSEEFNGSDWDEHGSGIAVVSDTYHQCESHDGQVQELGRRFITRCEMRVRRSPHPLDLDGKLNAEFVEYMMGLPEGWVTGLDISRAQQLKLLGNGVVPQQAYLALELLVGD